MFNKLRYKVAAILFTSVALTSCDDFFDINDDPNSPTDVEMRQILPAAQVNTGFLMGNNVQRFGAAFVQYYAGTNNQLLSWDSYNVVGSDSDADWNTIYAGVLQDLKQIDQLAAEEDNRYKGIAQVMRVYVLSVATDLWGDIPYSQATNGLGSINPEFESQEQIYTDLLLKIDNAIALLSSDELGANPGTADLVYQGDAAKWRKAAKSLKLKLLLQQRLRQPTQSKSGIDALIADNDLILANADNFRVLFLTTADRQHPMYDFAINSRAGDIAISSRFIDSLAVTNDPRRPLYFNSQGQVQNGNPWYRGFDNGGVGTPPLTTVRAILGPYAIGTNGEAPQRFITAAQVNFMLAEAALTLATSGNAREYFSKAIDLSMADVGVGPAAATTYRDARLAAFDALADDTQKLRVVIRDKWASQFTMAFESWNDWRRTGFPLLAPATVNVSPDGLIPTSLPYSAQELQSNPKAPDQVAVNRKVWWDLN